MGGETQGAAGGEGGVAGRLKQQFKYFSPLKIKLLIHLKGDDVDGPVSRGLEIHQLQGSSQGQGWGAGGVHLTNITIINKNYLE